MAVLGTVRPRSQQGLLHVTTRWTLIDGATAPLLLAVMDVFHGLSGMVGGLFG